MRIRSMSINVMCIVKVHSEQIDPRNGVFFYSISRVDLAFTLLMYSG